MQKRLAGRVCLVTGSTRGIGRAIAGRFAAEGARVVVTGRTQQNCDEVASSLGKCAFGLAADISSSDAVDQLVATVVDRVGGVDVLVNNAGVARDGFVTRLSNEDWEAVLATNLSGPFYAIRAVVPSMKQRGGGSIINMLSWAGLRGNVGQAGYAASKAGLFGLTLTCAKELAKFGIRVNAVSPMAPTDMTSQMSEELKEMSVKRVPLHRFGETAEVAEAALFLASSAASFTTGQVLNVDGGLHMT